MSRTRRNKRTNSIIINHITTKTFITVLLVLISIIATCIVIVGYRKESDAKLLLMQKEELNKQIEDIFAATVEDIGNVDGTPRTDTIVKISVVGDILCGKAMLEDAYNEETKEYTFSHMFRQMPNYLNKSDIVIGTLETNFTNEPASGYLKYNAPKSFAKAVQDSGVNLVSLSHNHSLDYGISGIRETEEVVDSLGLEFIGTNFYDNTIFIKEQKGIKIAFLSYTYGVENQNNYSQEELKCVNVFNEEQVKKDLEKAKEQSDFICVLIHWGEVNSSEINDEQSKMADFLVEYGADMILGSHPSVIEPMEIRKNAEGKNVFIAYSIGNYISSSNYETSNLELILNVELRKSAETKEVYLNKVNYTPIYVWDKGKNAQERYELIGMKDTAKEYANGNTDKIDRELYDKLVKGLEKIEELIKK